MFYLFWIKATFSWLKFDWDKFLVKGIMKDIFNQTIKMNDTVIVEDIEYLKQVVEVFKNAAKNSKRFLLRINSNLKMNNNNFRNFH